jgi:hypothetical protein
MKSFWMKGGKREGVWQRIYITQRRLHVSAFGGFETSMNRQVEYKTYVHIASKFIQIPKQ